MEVKEERKERKGWGGREVRRKKVVGENHTSFPWKIPFFTSEQ